MRSTSTCDHLQPPSVNQLRGSWGRHVRHARLLPPEASERACINACINDRLQSMQGTYINLSTRESMEYRRLRFLRIKPRRRRFQRSLRETSLTTQMSLPHLTAAVTRLSHRRPLSAPCPRAPRKISRIRIFSLKIALPTKPCPSNSHCPKAIDAPQRTRERRTHPCTALEILQSLTTLTKPSRPTLTYKTCVGVPSIQHRLRRPSSTKVCLSVLCLVRRVTEILSADGRTVACARQRK